MTTQRTLLFTLLFLFGLMGLALSASAYEAGEKINVNQVIADMKAYYDSRDEWPRSHGWKPYKRYEWDLMQRAYPDGEIPAGAIWEAFQQRQRMPHAALDETWTALGPFNHGGRTRVIRFHPVDQTIMFVGAVGGGLFKSVDSGQNWFPITDDLPNLAVGSFEIHPECPDTMFLGTGEGYLNIDAIKGIGLLRSIDGGQSWQTTGMSYPYTAGKSIYEIDLDPRNPNIVFASNTTGLYKSIDAGDNFVLVRAGNIDELQRDPQNPDVMLCSAADPFGGSGGSVYRSADNGDTWSSVNTGLPNPQTIGRIVLTFYPGNSQIVYAGISGTSSHNGNQMIGIYRSIDNGNTWIQMSLDGESHYASQGWYDMAIAVKPDDATIVYSSGLDLYRSWNSGMFWDQKTDWWQSYGHPRFVHADHHDIIFHPDNPEELWAATDGGVFKSTDGGTNWTEMNQGYNTFQYYAMGNATLDTVLAYGGTQDNGTSKYVGDPNWDEVFGGDGGYCVVDYTDDDVVYVEYQYGARHRSDDGGHNFVSINEGITGNGAWVTPMILDPFDHNTIYTTTTNGGVWKSTSRGDFNNWENIGPAGSQNQVMAASPLVPGLLYIGSSGAVYRRDPVTEQWSQVTGNLPGRTVTRVVPDPFSPDGVYVTVSGFGNGHVYKSTQGGNVWEDISGNLPDVPFQDVIVDLTEPGTLYAGGDLGVYRTLDGGENWEIYGEGMPVVRVDDMEMQTVSGKLRVATHGRGMWEIQTGSSDLALLYPNGDEILAIGQEIDFRWSGLTHTGDVSLDINRNYPEGAWESLFTSINNDGFESWTVTGPASDNVRFRIIHDSIAGQSDTSDVDTRIAVPALEIVYPNGGETVLTGRFDEILFNRIMVDELIRIELNRDYPDAEWEVLTDNEGNADSYRWIVHLPGGEHCRVRLTSTERPEITVMSAEDFTLRSPLMTILSPNGGEQINTGTTYEVRWNAEEHDGRIRVTLNRNYPDGEWEILGSNIANNGLLNWTVSEPATQHARVRVALQLDPLQSYTESAEDFAIITLAADDPVIPNDFSISEAYPNPFNPSTQIRLELPMRSAVDARVFNHLGQQVALLANENFDAGIHHLTFDATSLSSGTYFIHINAMNETKILKAVLLK